MTSSWLGSLSLELQRSGARTVIGRRRHRGPLLVQRAFYDPDGGCQVYLLHPPGGVVGGDQLSTEVKLLPAASALLTTPAATKLYRSAGNEARLHQRFDLANDSTLEWLPQETIAYDGARARMETSVSLEAGAHFVGWEIVCLGRDAGGFRQGRLVQRWSVERAGRLLWSERAVLAGGAEMLEAPWGLGGYPVLGTLVATGASAALVESVRSAFVEGAGDEMAAGAADLRSVTQLGEVLICRYLGYSAEAAKRWFSRGWSVLRDRVSARKATSPRIWAT